MSIPVTVPPEVRQLAADTVGRFFQPISGIDPAECAENHLDTEKSVRRAEILQRYTPLQSKRVIEIGSGFGTNLAVWVKQFGADAYGVEPDGAGFASSFSASRRLLEANGIAPERVIDARGEDLPFQDGAFDIAYSANVLEHTQDPLRVLQEAVRVLRPGGVLHFEMPNFLSYFEGHYMVLQPPLIYRGLLPVWVRTVYGRDPAFARTLNTYINPLWCHRAVRRLRRAYPVELLSLGEELFLERISRSFSFETTMVAGKLRSLISLLQRANFCNWIGHLIVGARGFYPIYLTLRRESP